MDVKTLLDYAQFQLSPRRTRCELFVSRDGKTEKLASGSFKPFLTHLRVAEEQASSGVQSINLEFERKKNVSTWFSKGTLERFVRFVSTPEVLEMVNTYYAEMSQLEGARKIYSQEGSGGQLSGQLGEAETAAAAAADVTKKELLRAIDVRLVALKQDLVTASARASAAGFTLDTVSELLLFSDQFGALRLHDACTKFMLLCEQRPELLGYQQSLPPQWKGFDDDNIRSSGSDMSIDELDMEPADHSRPSIGCTRSTVPKIHKPSSSGHVLQKTTDETKSSASSLVEKASDKAKEELIPALSSNGPSQAAGGGSRRLSVQDRINMFESKQKEQTGSASISSISSSGAGGINKVEAGKGEHRRLPSDVSMAKSVLRRWSGASDMSIDLNNNSFTSDRKESGSVAGTPTSSVCLQVQSACKDEEEASGLKDTATSRFRMGLEDNPASNSASFSLLEAQVKAFPKDRIPSEDVLRGGITTTFKAQSEQSFEEHGDFETQFDSSFGREHQGALIDRAAAQVTSELVSDSRKEYGVKDQEAIETKFIATSEINAGPVDQAPVQIPSRTVPATLPGGRAVSTVEVKSQATSMTKFRAFAGKMNTDEKAEGPLDSQIHSKTSLGKREGDTPKSDLLSEHQWKTYPGNQVEAKKEVASSSQMPLKTSSVELEKESGSQAMNLHGKKSASDQIKKVQGRRDERMPKQGTRLPAISGNHEGGDVLEPPSKLPMEKAQVMRSSKGNYELNDELKIKANELEKLFAAHKLRVHGDQMASLRRSKSVDDHVLESGERGLLQSIPDQLLERDFPRDRTRSGVESDVNLLRMVDNLNNDKGMKQELGDHSPSDDSRGTLYEKYTQKRDAKLREDWGMKRAQKEANMKAMHDNLVRSQAEMKAKFASSGDKQDSAFARRRAEKMRSFNARSHIKDKGQALELLHVESEELQGLEEAPYGRDRSFSDTLSGNESSTSSKRLVSSKSLSSSTRKTSINPIPRPSAKTSNSSSIHRRALPENPLIQSVPNFSEFRKENTKPLTGLSKIALAGQPRAFARSKTTIEESNIVKEEKSHRSHSMRKSLANTGESKNLTPLSYDAANQTSMRFPNEHAHEGINKILKSGEPKSFLGKGNCVHPGAGAGISKLKALTNTELLNDDEESEGLVDQQEDSPEVVKDDEEEFDRTSAEGNFQATDFHQDSYSDGDPGSENGDMHRSLSHAGDDFAVVSSKFDPSAGTLHDSPGESPRSWNFNTQHSFSYAHEASDVDAFVDSPSGSPASWNSHPLNNIVDADAARMRGKWGSAQIPVLVANVPNHARKDVTKGFKRLLKFGRKSKGAEYLVNDWVSVSTASEGDDDTEDGRELGNRSSEDLRKSRMGYSIPAYGGFNEGDTFPEHVQSLRNSIPDASANFKFREDHLSGSSIKAPRSFFSLSSFRKQGK